LTVVADAIREKGGTSEKLAFPNGMADAVRGIQSGGDNYYDEFWDAFQDYGQLKQYTGAFRSARWNDETFKPKYSFVGVTSINAMFNDASITDLTMALERANVTLDASKATYVDAMFRNSKVTRVPYLDLSKAYNCSNMFNGCTDLECIDGIEFPNKTYTTMFANCKSLKSITVGSGTIRDTISFDACLLLSDESIQSIIDGLADLTGSTAKTITFHADVKAKLTEAQISQITSKNWTLA
jgi:hypothetical protein